MKQFQTTNKKTNEVFKFIKTDVETKRVTIENVADGVQKEVAESTFKRWYTKFEEVEVAEEVVTEENEVDIVAVEEVKEEAVVEETVVQETKEEAKEEVVIQNNAYRVNECNELVENSTVEEMRAYLEDCLSITEMGDATTEMVQCKDGIVAIRFMGKTVAQIKGKRKVRVYLNGRHMSEETFEKCEHDKPQYTHNAFIKVEDLDSLELVFKAVNEVKDWVRQNKSNK